MLKAGDEFKLVKGLLNQNYKNQVFALCTKVVRPVKNGQMLDTFLNDINSGKISQIDDLYSYLLMMFDPKSDIIPKEQFDSELSDLASGPIHNIWLTTQSGGRRKNRKERKSKKQRKNRKSKKTRRN